MQKHLHHLSLCLLGGLALACGGDNTGSGTIDALTLIAVDPADFPSAATGNKSACGSSVGYGSYVAELIDVSQITDVDIDQEGRKLPNFPVQSSPPTACDRSVAFGRVVENREYIARVSTYADTDGDPNTVDVCTREGTSVTVTRENGECTSVPAKPVLRFSCYGWQKPGVVAVSDPQLSNGAAGAPGAVTENVTSAQSTGASTPATVAGCEGTGCAGVAIEYRTMTLRYCVPGSW